LENIEEAKKCLEHADKIRHQVNTVPWQLSNFCRSHFEYDLYKLKESLENDNKSAIADYRRKAIKSGRKMLKQSKKVAQHRTGSYRLKGIHSWLNNNQKNALKWWNKSIREGKRLGARLDLSRTYHKVGTCLLETGSKYKKLNGITAEEYLIKARALSEEMGLQRDLNELNRVARN
jgi:hypothetical protein